MSDFLLSVFCSLFSGFKAMINSQKFWKTITPAQTLLMGFILMIVAGVILLSLPLATVGNTHQPLVDVLFTATSAVTTTGLIVVDTGSFYSFFGQIVILSLIQICGLGYMIFIALIILGVGGRMSISNRVLLSESLAHPTSIDMVRFTKIVVIFAFFIEFIGALFLSGYWMRYFSFGKAVYAGIFHSISAFCTAGFSVFSDSFSAWGKSFSFNLFSIFIFTAGAIGFFVLHDIYSWFRKNFAVFLCSCRHSSAVGGGQEHRTFMKKKYFQLATHSKFVLLLTAILVGFGAVVIFFSQEWLLQSTPELSLKGRVLNAVFQSFTASTTTGFNTVNIGAMSTASLFVMIVLMFIGASPGGTGAGIKTVSFGIVLLFLFALLTGKENVNLFKRRIPSQIINKVFAICSIAILWVVLAVTVLIFTEKASFLQILFEVVSALSNVGLSTGITSSLSNVGKIVISITMLVGRMGPLAIGFSLVGNPKPKHFKYAQADILVG